MCQRAKPYFPLGRLMAVGKYSAVLIRSLGLTTVDMAVLISSCAAAKPNEQDERMAADTAAIEQIVKRAYCRAAASVQ